MDFELTNYIRDISTIEDSDGNCIDVIELNDERLVAIDGEFIALFEDMGQLKDSLDGEVECPRIDL